MDPRIIGKCETCSGSGRVPLRRRVGKLQVVDGRKSTEPTTPCHACNGYGEVENVFVTEEEQPAERVTFKSIRLEFSNGDTSETKFPTHLVEGSKTHGICARRPEHPYPSTMLYFDRLEPSFATKEVVYVFKERAKPAAEEGATL